MTTQTESRCEVLWHFYCKAEKKHVTRWLPGVLLYRRSDGRCEVRTDCGKSAADAAPECVRQAIATN